MGELMKLITVLALFLSVSAYASANTYQATWAEVTKRSDTTPATGTITYQLYGGNINGPFTELVNTDQLNSAGEIELVGAGEFYVITCEDDTCGEESKHIVAQCGRSVIGTTNLTVNVTCN